MAIVSKVVRADAETTGTSLAKLRAKEAELVRSKAKGRVWLAQEFRRGIAGIELELQSAM